MNPHTTTKLTSVNHSTNCVIQQLTHCLPPSDLIQHDLNLPFQLYLLDS